LFYRGSVLANLLPVEEATKAESLSTLPSLKRSLGPSELLFSNHLGIKLPARTTTQLVSLASITSECLITRRNAKEKKRSKPGTPLQSSFPFNHFCLIFLMNRELRKFITCEILNQKLSNQFCWILNIMDYQLKILNPMLSVLNFRV
jgi:hypothetical protein